MGISNVMWYSNFITYFTTWCYNCLGIVFQLNYFFLFSIKIINSAMFMKNLTFVTKYTVKCITLGALIVFRLTTLDFTNCPSAFVVLFSLTLICVHLYYFHFYWMIHPTDIMCRWVFILIFKISITSLYLVCMIFIPI
jgi:hypothetical protein